MESLLEKANRLGIQPQSPIKQNLVATPSPDGSESLLQKAQRLGIKPQSNTAIDQLRTPQPSYFQRVGESYKQSGQDIIEAVKSGAQELQKSQTGQQISTIDAIKGAGSLLRTGLRTVGTVAKSAFAPIFEAPIIKPALEKVAKSITNIPGANELITGIGSFAKNNPELARDAEDIFNIATLGAGKSVYQPLKKEAGAILRDVEQATKVALTPSEEAVQKNVIDLFNKSVKPTAKKTVSQGERYQNDILSSLKTIKNNANKLQIEDATGEIVTRSPETLNELSQAVNQTKKIVFDEYDALAKRAGDAGARIDATSVADEVAKISENTALRITNPEVISYAQSWAERLRSIGFIDSETAQSVIKNLNEGLNAFYKNPTYDSASRVAIDALVANNFRKSLDSVIENLTGENYQALKNQYSALKAIENDVTRASMREARKNLKGLLDYTDIFTGGQMLSGILSLNPGMFTKGAIERGLKEYLKFLNDPNRAVKNIFDSLSEAGNKTFTPSSATVNYLRDYIKNPKAGLGVQEVSQNKINQAVLENLDEIENAVNSVREIAGKINLDDISFVEGLRNQRINDLTKEEVRRIYEILASKGRDDVVDTINKSLQALL